MKIQDGHQVGFENNTGSTLLIMVRSGEMLYLLQWITAVITVTPVSTSSSEVICFNRELDIGLDLCLKGIYKVL